MPKSRFGRFTIEEEIGAGGMGRVFRGHDPVLRRAVAIKILREAGPDSREALLAEARSASRLNHPHVCTIYEVGDVENVPYIAMEIVEGEPLDARLARGQIPACDVPRFGMQIAAALAHAHERGVVHGDLNGRNVMVTRHGDIKLLDFGLARTLDPVSMDSITRAGADTSNIAGTLPYIAPETLNGTPVTPAADVWALGVLLQELVSRARPFSGRTVFELADAIRHAPPAPLPPDTPPALGAVIARCLQKDAARRYASARDVLAALEPLAAATETREPNRRTTASRRRAVAIAAIVLAATAVATYLWRDWRKAPASQAAISSMIVLPFDNLSGNGNDDYFAAGMTDALITDLSRIPGLKVISQTTAARYKAMGKTSQEIARELGVHAIVDGAVLRADDQVRISVRLVDAASDANMWGREHTRTVANVLALQADVAREIAGEIRTSFLPVDERRLAAAATVNPRALDEYLKGRHMWEQRTSASLQQAIAHFREAIALQPDFAAAYAGLAQALVVMPALSVGATSSLDTMPHVREAAERAIALDDRLAEAHAALGYERLNALDWAGSDAAFRRALAVNPNYATAHFWYAVLLAATGKFPESLAEARRAQALDPLSPILICGVSWMHHLARAFDREVELADAALAIEPNFIVAHYRKGTGLLHQQQMPQAIAALETAHTLGRESPGLLATMAYAYARAGRTADARALLRRLVEAPSSKALYVSPYGLALVYAGLDDRDQAFTWLERAVAERAWGVALVPVEPDFDPLRSDSRFAALAKRVRSGASASPLPAR